MTKDRKAQLLREIEVTLKADLRFSRLGTLFVCEMTHKAIGISMFWDRGNYVAHSNPNYDHFIDIMYDLWELDAPGRRWRQMELLLRGKVPEVKFLPKQDILDAGMERERIETTSARYFGDKRVVDPSWY
ncbi:MAG: hypothetical protein HEQ21_17735 [Blastomonas sp.]|uniref:hypothetical protein n=1 Tax=Blastomonas sp. TaxID=1909299 RepID=UPI002587084A|nr:hypothetical protein [Blastomonas sp.]MCO5794660.1 hypothetical protein [Blastomonas sp.]